MKQKPAEFCAAHRLLVADAAAALCGIALTLYFVLTAKIGIGLPDELYNFTIPFRVMHGDAFLVHDWSIEQISQLVNILPYWAFVKIIGSTDGLLLFSRCFFICVNACFYVYMYLKLRKKIGLWAVLAAFLFCAVLPPTGLCLYYYNISAMAIMHICLLLFLDTGRKSAVRLFFAGFIWGIAILEEPMVFLMCVILILAVLARVISKNRIFESCSFFVSPRSLGWLALGAFMVQLLFIFVIRITGGIDIVMETIPYFLGNSGYSGGSLFDFWKISDVIACYGIPGLLLGFVSFCMAVVYAAKQKKAERVVLSPKKRKSKALPDGRLRMMAFAFSCLGFAMCNLWGLRGIPTLSYDLLRKYVLYQNFLLLVFPPVWYLLCQKRRTDVLLIYLMGFGYSLFSDISSDVMLGLGGTVTMLAGILSLRTLIPEMKSAVSFKNEYKKHRSRTITVSRLVIGSFVLMCVSFVAFKGIYIYGERLYPTEERGSILERRTDEIDTVMVSGPMKGVKTTDFIAGINEATQRDLDIIRANDTDGSPVMFAGVCPSAYFYMDLPVGCSTLFFQKGDYATQQDYWSMFPEKIPAYIYLPDFDYYTYRNKKDSDKRIDINKIIPADVTYEVTEMEAGRLVVVNPSEKTDLD